jgi:hypothetical protein
VSTKGELSVKENRKIQSNFRENIFLSFFFTLEGAQKKLIECCYDTPERGSELLCGLFQCGLFGA